MVEQWRIQIICSTSCLIVSICLNVLNNTFNPDTLRPTSPHGPSPFRLTSSIAEVMGWTHVAGHVCSALTAMARAAYNSNSIENIVKPIYAAEVFDFERRNKSN